MKKTYSFFLLLLLLSFTVHAQIITTVAGGNDTAVYTLGDNGPATDCKLHYPIGVAVDATGNIYIGDRDDHRVRKVSATGIVTTIAGTGTMGYTGDNGQATDAKINSPAGVTTDAAGNIYFCDLGNNCIRKINPAGIITTIAGNDTQGFSGDNGPATNAQLYWPEGIALDGAANIYITDANNNRVRKIDASGMITTIAGGVVLSTGDGDGGPATMAELIHPYSIFIDAADNIYVGEDAGHRIRKVDNVGIITTIAGTGIAGFTGNNGPATSAQLGRTLGIVVDVHGNILFSDSQYDCIRMINGSGIISIIAGTEISGDGGDGGPASAATLNQPVGLACDAAGNLYFSDFANSKIRKITNPLASGNVVREGSKDISVYPNPTTGNFTVHIFGIVSAQMKIVITNVLGEQVMEIPANSNKNIEINLDVPAGVYMLSAISEHGTWSEKISVVKSI